MHLKGKKFKTDKIDAADDEAEDMLLEQVWGVSKAVRSKKKAKLDDEDSQDDAGVASSSASSAFKTAPPTKRKSFGGSPTDKSGGADKKAKVGLSSGWSTHVQKLQVDIEAIVSTMVQGPPCEPGNSLSVWCRQLSKRCST